jgi:hypothetical protein
MFSSYGLTVVHLSKTRRNICNPVVNLSKRNICDPARNVL